jgi:DNA-binding response OmpR family regulator
VERGRERTTPLRSKKILVVEDKDHLREAILEAFQAWDFDVVALADADEAREWLIKNPLPDLLVTDYKMKGGGHNLARALKEANVPVLMISALPSEAKEALKDVKVDAIVVSKPFNINQFIDLAHKLLGIPLTDPFSKREAA